jgi:hypothetical protein
MIALSWGPGAWRVLLLAAAGALGLSVPVGGDNLVSDPSFEASGPRDQFGRVFPKWGGWNYEGACSFEVGMVAHSGQTSALLMCSGAGKIRIAQDQDLQAGRYLITAYIRGMDIGSGTWNNDAEFMFNGNYIQLKKHGDFGWSRLTYVVELAKPAKAGPSFGLWAPGWLWIDDVSVQRVDGSVPLTGVPVIDKEEAPIAPPGPLGAGAVRCSVCGARNMPAWGKCHACGNPLTAAQNRAAGSAVKLIASFEQTNPFSGGTVVPAHATDGQKALRIDRGYVAMVTPQDWSGYDILKLDTYTDSIEPLPVTVEIQDRDTTGYWTRVNYPTVVPPGAGSLTLALGQLYVGEKGRPGRRLIPSGITRLVLAVDSPPAPLFVDNIRLERAPPDATFDGLLAFDLGPAGSPVMDGFTAITPGTAYSARRGFGLKDAKIWRSFDALQPDPLYQDFICIESGGLAVDVPNGRYHVFVNIDSPSGFWGEYQSYTERSVFAQGKQVVRETMDFAAFEKKYFRFWDTEDRASEDTFDKYQKAFFSPKQFDVTVNNGQLHLEFRGANWANSVSAIIIYPAEKAADGERFLRAVEERRRFYFNNSFKRVLHPPSGEPPRPTPEETARGYVMFQRKLMEDVFDNDTPRAGESRGPFVAGSFPGQQATLSAVVLPLRDLGTGTIRVTGLSGPGGNIPAGAIETGYVSYRLTRVTSDGGVYTIAPRWILPKNSVAMPAGVARRFWVTIRIPASSAAGEYAGVLTFTPASGPPSSVQVRLKVRKGELDALDIPAGPWGGEIGIPWVAEDPETARFGAEMTAKSLDALRERGFTMFSGLPRVGYRGFRDGKPLLDFSGADDEMQRARELGFLAVNSYGAGIGGFTPYFQDTGKMAEAGFKRYSEFIRAVYTAVQQHAAEKHWLPVYWNLGDEPSGDDEKRSAENARAYREAFPSGPPYFTAAMSLSGRDLNDSAHILAASLHTPNLNAHDEDGVRWLRGIGEGWGFYNGGNRWTFGDYLYKAAKEFGLAFRLAWHWNLAAGDPYYALDCREDDYAWANAAPGRRLLFSVEFARISAGVEDYRMLLTLARLARRSPGSPASQAAARLIASRMEAFHLGQRDHDQLFGVGDWEARRRQVADAIEALR